MRILDIDNMPLAMVPYWAVGPRGGVQDMDLPILRGVVDALPEGLEGIICAADLQGVGRDEELHEKVCRPSVKPLGQLLLEELVDLSEHGKIPALDRLGVLLLGDLFARPELDRRGGNGDVREIWRMFAKHSRFLFVAGVAGNHDTFGNSKGDYEAFIKQESGIHILDGEVLDLCGIRVGGISGVTGNPRRPFRKSPHQFLRTLGKLLESAPDVVALHEGPNLPNSALKGNPQIASLLYQHHQSVLVSFGHAFWPEPFHTIGNGVQLLNVDSRAILLEAAAANKPHPVTTVAAFERTTPTRLHFRNANRRS